MDIVGIDVSTKTCSSSHVDEDGRIKTCLEFANEPAGWTVLERDLGPDSVVVLEAGTAAVATLNASFGLADGTAGWPWWTLGLVAWAFAGGFLWGIARAGTEAPPS